MRKRTTFVIENDEIITIYCICLGVGGYKNVCICGHKLDVSVHDLHVHMDIYHKIHMQELVNVCANVRVWVGDVLLMSLLLSMLSFAVCGWVGNVLLMSLYLYTVFYNVCVGGWVMSCC